MNIEKKEINHFTSLYQQLEKVLPGGSMVDISGTRKQAITWFGENGFPTLHEEEWRFTDVSPLRKTDFFPARSTEQPQVSMQDIEPFINRESIGRLVFLNGHWSPKLSSIQSLPPGLTCTSLQQAMEEKRGEIQERLTKQIDIKQKPFAALNTALFQDGAYLNVADSVVVEKPIQLLFISKFGAAAGLSTPRNLIRVGKNSQIPIDERFVTLDQGIYFNNVVSEIILAENAQLYHYKIQLESERAFHFGLMHIEQNRFSHFVSQSHSFAGQIIRNDIHSLLNGEGAECTLDGLYLAQNHQLVDNHTIIEHAKPHCNSRELYKGILSHQARAVFSGKIHVHQDAQKTDAIQSNQNLLLSEEAIIDTKPQLEIYADDVRCTHGGTVGQLDEDGIFYLRSRGISKDKARHLMIQAFAGQVVDAITDNVIRETVSHLVEMRLQDNSSRFLEN